MNGIRSLLSRRKPVVVDISSAPRPHLPPVILGPESIPRTDELAASAIETRSAAARSVTDLQRDYVEVMEVVRKIGEHLDTQAERMARLSTVLERLPQVIDALPEVNRHNARLLDVLGDHLDRAKARENAAQLAIDRVTETSGHQTEVLGLIRQNLESNQQATIRMTESLAAFRQSLGELNDSNRRSSDAFAALAEGSSSRQRELTSQLSRTRVWLIAAVALFAVGLLAALLTTAATIWPQLVAR